MIAWRRFTRLRLWHMIVVIAVLCIVFAYLARRWREPTALMSNLSFSHAYTPRPNSRPAFQAVFIHVHLPEAGISFIDFPPYGSADECSVYRRGNPSTSVNYHGPNATWRMHPPIPAQYERRYQELFALYMKRLSVERQAFLRDPVGSGIDPSRLPEEHILIGLTPNVLEPREPGIDYDYWLTPPDRW